MVTFRKKPELIKNLMPEALDYLTKQGLRPNLITQDQAEYASRVNSKSMVLESFIKNEGGFFEIKIRDKELYNYTQKLIKDIFQMRITDIDKKTRTVTAEIGHYGRALDVIEVLAMKYNLSIVNE